MANNSPGVYTSVSSVVARSSGNSGARILVIGTNVPKYTPDGSEAEVITPTKDSDVIEITSQKELVQICGDPTVSSGTPGYTDSPAVKAAYVILAAASRVYWKSINAAEDSAGEPTKQSFIDAMSAVSDTDSYIFDFILAPEAANIDSDGTKDGYDGVIAAVAKRKDCILLIDTPIGASDDEAVTFNEGIYDRAVLAGIDKQLAYTSTWHPAAVYDFSAAQKGKTVPISGFIAMKEAQNQRENNISHAVAGFKRGDLSGISLAAKLSQGSRDKLYAANINPVSIYRGQGPIILGNRTNLKPEEDVVDGLQYLSVVRMVNAIKETVSRYAGQILFDMGGEYLWTEFKNLVTPYLDSVKNGGGIEDYRIIMDSSNNTEMDINKGIAYGTIILDPSIPCERIELTFEVSPAGVSFS